MTWKHIRDLYDRCRIASDRSGLSVLPKLNLEHVDLTLYSRMRVDLAAQVRLCFNTFADECNCCQISCNRC